jgi:hypothetical protein
MLLILAPLGAAFNRSTKPKQEPNMNRLIALCLLVSALMIGCQASSPLDPLENDRSLTPAQEECRLDAEIC